MINNLCVVFYHIIFGETINNMEHEIKKSIIKNIKYAQIVTVIIIHIKNVLSQ